MQQEVGDCHKLLVSPVDPLEPDPTSHSVRQVDKGVKKWFAVVVGEVPGMYSAWKGLDFANWNVSGYSGRSYKTFEMRKAAEKWLKANLVSSGGLLKQRVDRFVCLAQARMANRSVEARSSTTEHSGRVSGYQDLYLRISVSAGPAGRSALISTKRAFMLSIIRTVTFVNSLGCRPSWPLTTSWKIRSRTLS